VNQKLPTPFQLKWLPKLLGYDYEIVLKKGINNAAADAFSRVNQGAELLQIVGTNVDRTLQSREEIVKMLKFYMKRAQDRMESQANKHRTYREFKVGNWVYLKLQPHRQVTVRQGQEHKLSAKYYGPFLIVERVGRVAYKLQLANHSQIHLIFHISQLKKCHRKGQQMGSLPHLKEDGLLYYKPMEILERRLGKVNNKPVMYVLIQWINRTVEEATWEIYADVLARFSDFDAA
nr:retrotransposable element Tf2 [Tanacetum cinerariifolium]